MPLYASVAAVTLGMLPPKIIPSVDVPAPPAPCLFAFVLATSVQLVPSKISTFDI